MAPNLLIIKDEKDHVTKVANEIVRVLNSNSGSRSVEVYGIRDHIGFRVVTNKTFVLFLITEETKSVEKHVPKWLTMFNKGDHSKQKFRYLVVRELQTCLEQTQIANQKPTYWIENERIKCERGTAVQNMVDVDQINSILKWWPGVIRRIFKTKASKYKVNVVTDDKQVEIDTDLYLKVERIKCEITGFLKSFQGFRENPCSSTNYKLFVVGDPCQFYENHKQLRVDKVNGCKIILILVRERTVPELRTISTSQIFLSNMIRDILQLMVDLEIVPERQGLRKTKQSNPVNQISMSSSINSTIQISLQLKNDHDASKNPGTVSVQIKSKSNETWEEIASKETSESRTVEIKIPNTKFDHEFRVVFEDAKTGNMSSPVLSNHDSKIGTIALICLPILILNLAEYLAVCLIALPLIIVAYTCCNEDKEMMFITEIVIPPFVLVEKLAMAIFIPVYFGPIYAIPAVANLVLPSLFYVCFFKDDIKMLLGTSRK